MSKYLDENGVLYFWQKIKASLAGKEPTITTKNTAFNKNFETASNNIKMNGTASAGSSDNVARSDHVHPSDTAKLGTSGNASNVTVTFTAAAARANITTGEKLSVILGKLAKWFADFNKVAFSGNYTDLSNKPTIPNKMSELTNDSGYQTAEQVQNIVNEAVGTVYRWRGTKASYSELPTTGNVVGDVWDTADTGMNYGWTGTAWDPLGAEFSVEAITNTEIDTIMAS